MKMNATDTPRRLSLSVIGLVLLGVLGAACGVSAPVPTLDFSEIIRAATLTAQATVSSPATPLPSPSPTSTPPEEPTPKEPQPSGLPTVEAQPTPEEEAAAAAAFKPIYLERPAQQVTVEEISDVPPADVLREISYSGGFGGGVSECTFYTFTEPAFPSYDPIVLEWNDRIWLDTCGWRPNEELISYLVSPSGETGEASETRAHEDGSSHLIEVPLNAEPGIYQIVVQGASGEIRRDIEVPLPNGPKMFYLQEPEEFILYNFEPNERVRVFVYADTTGVNYQAYFRRIVSWDEFRTDADGQLRLKYDMSKIINEAFDFRFVAIGDESGEVHHEIGSALTNAEVRAYVPSVSELETTESIWRRASYQDLLKPGTQTYNVSNIPASKGFTWRFTWCGADPNTLRNIMGPLKVEFKINGAALNPDQLRRDDGPSPNGWECNRWVTYIPEWPPNSTVELEIHYNLSQPIFDGRTTYPAGEYHQIINVQVGD